jgi:hypothetical protein
MPPFVILKGKFPIKSPYCALSFDPLESDHSPSKLYALLDIVSRRASRNISLCQPQLPANHQPVYLFMYRGFRGEEKFSFTFLFLNDVHIVVEKTFG